MVVSTQAKRTHQQDDDEKFTPNHKRVVVDDDCMEDKKDNTSSNLKQEAVTSTVNSTSNGNSGDSSNIDDDLDVLVDKVLKDHYSGSVDDQDDVSLLPPSSSYRTKSGWCLKEGLIHVIQVEKDNGSRKNSSSGGSTMMKHLIKQHGPPKIFTATTISPQQISNNKCRHNNSNNPKGDQNISSLTDDPKNCFQSLCRIVAGQQLAGAAAVAMWNRLLEVTKHNLTPEMILSLIGPAENDLELKLRKPAGLSNAKAKSIVALSKAFKAGELSEEFLTKEEDMTKVRSSLLAVKGIGPWSCDMFLMFYLEKSNILPVGDLGVRKGMQKYCTALKKGNGYKGSLCPKKDLQRIQEAAQPYEPYQSIFSYYMWKVADTTDFYDTATSNKDGDRKLSATPLKTTTAKVATPKKKRARIVTRQVTP